MEMEKNARLRLQFDPEDYPSVDLEFEVNEDLTLFELLDFFKKFAYAMGYCVGPIEKFIDENY